MRKGQIQEANYWKAYNFQIYSNNSSNENEASWFSLELLRKFFENSLELSLELGRFWQHMAGM